MLRMVTPLAVGNAVRLYLALTPGMEYSRVLRRTTDAFTGAFDSGAVVIGDEVATDFLVDASDSLINGTQVFYRCYDYDGATWHDQGVSFPATPATTYVPDVLDPQEFVRDRVQLGINAAIASGQLLPPSGAIQVTTAPFSVAEGTSFPTVSVHLENTGPETRGIGDELEDFFDQLESKWLGTEGWLARTNLNIVGVSQNADERIQLRKVLRQVIQANLPVFAGVGFTLVEFSQSDSEQFSENNVPLYVTNGGFSCVSAAFVRDPAGVISEVTLDPGVQTSGMQTADYYGVNDVV